MDVVLALPCGWFEVAKFSKPQIKRSSTSFLYVRHPTRPSQRGLIDDAKIQTYFDLTK